MKELNFFEGATLTGQLLLLIAFLVGVIRYRSLQQDQMLLFYLLCITIGVETASEILWRMKMNNLFLSHFFAIIELSILTTIYKKHMAYWIKPVYFNGFVILFLFFALANMLFFQGLTEFNSNVTSVSSLSMIVLAVLYFYQLLRDLEHISLQYVPMFWINMSVLTYFSGSLILFFVANDLLSLSRGERQAVWGVHALFNVVHYGLYCVAFLTRASKPKTYGTISET